MSEKIDCGNTIYIKEYPLPKNIKSIENSYDNEIRAKNFVDIIKSNKTYSNKVSKLKSYPLKYYYFIAHPIIRNIGINKASKNKISK